MDAMERNVSMKLNVVYRTQLLTVVTLLVLIASTTFHIWGWDSNDEAVVPDESVFLPEPLLTGYRWLVRTRAFNYVMELLRGGKPSTFNDETYGVVLYDRTWRPSADGKVFLVDMGTSEHALSRRGITSERAGTSTESIYDAQDPDGISEHIGRFLRGYTRARKACDTLAVRLGIRSAQDEGRYWGDDGATSFGPLAPYFCVNMPLREHATGARSHYASMDVRSDVVGDMRNEDLPEVVIDSAGCDLRTVAERLVDANREPVVASGVVDGADPTPSPSRVGYYRDFMLVRDMHALGQRGASSVASSTEKEAQRPQARVSALPYQTVANFTQRLMEESSRCMVRQRRCVCGPEIGMARAIALSVGPQRAHIFFGHRMAGSRAANTPMQRHGDDQEEALAEATFLAGDESRSWCPLHAGLDRVADVLGKQVEWDPRILARDRDASGYVYYVTVEALGQRQIAQDKWDTIAAKDSDAACIARCNRLAEAMHRHYKDNAESERSFL